MLRKMTPGTLRWMMNLWPPYLFAGIHVRRISEDWRLAEVELRMRPWNRNYVGVHFGGSIFSMSDPFWMLLTMNALGPGYLVWDQAGDIEFVKPGRGTLSTRFALDEATLDTLRTDAAGGEKVLRWFATDVIDQQGEIVAKVRKQLYVRRKRDRSA